MTDWRDTLTHCKPRMLGVLVNGVVGGSRVGADINREIYNVTKLTSESSPVPIQTAGLRPSHMFPPRIIRFRHPSSGFWKSWSKDRTLPCALRRLRLRGSQFRALGQSRRACSTVWGSSPQGHATSFLGSGGNFPLPRKRAVYSPCAHERREGVSWLK
jgi:hypothetical protein